MQVERILYLGGYDSTAPAQEMTGSQAMRYDARD